MNDEIKRLAALVSQGDAEACEALARALQRSGYRNAEATPTEGVVSFYDGWVVLNDRGECANDSVFLSKEAAEAYGRQYETERLSIGYPLKGPVKIMSLQDYIWEQRDYVPESYADAWDN